MDRAVAGRREPRREPAASRVIGAGGRFRNAGPGRRDEAGCVRRCHQRPLASASQDARGVRRERRLEQGRVVPIPRPAPQPPAIAVSTSKAPAAVSALATNRRISGPPFTKPREA